MGVDLGTAYIVVVVVNAAKEPVACAMRFAQVVKDGLVVDYSGGMRIVRELTQELEERLGRKLEKAAIAVPRHGRTRLRHPPLCGGGRWLSGYGSA